jgi:hypothetical protein
LYNSDPARIFKLEETREINEDSYRSGIPDQTDPKAIEIMNQMSVSHWDRALDIFLAATHKLVKDTLMEQLCDVFSHYRQTSIYKELVRIINQYLEMLLDEHSKHTQENYNIEYNKPFTMATSSLQQMREEILHYLIIRRRRAKARYFLELHGGLPLDEQKREAEIRKVTDTDLGHDDYEQELKMMAVRFYN